MIKTDKNFRISKSTKRLMATLQGEARRLFKLAMISAEVSASKNERMTMMYDVNINGKKSKAKLDS